MRNLIFGTVLLLAASVTVIQAQDVPSRLDEARSAYQAGNLDGARFALQEALNEINRVIGKKILDLLPSEMGGMTPVEGSDNYTGTSMGFAGMYVNREYSGENTTAAIEIISDSPMLAGINAILAMPGFMTSDENQKRIKVSNYKALLTKSTDDEGTVSYDIQVPFSSSLMTFRTRGIADEDKVTGMVNKLPVDQIVKLTQ